MRSFWAAVISMWTRLRPHWGSAGTEPPVELIRPAAEEKSAEAERSAAATPTGIIIGDHEDDRLLNTVLGEGILSPAQLARVREAQRRIREAGNNADRSRRPPGE